MQSSIFRHTAIIFCFISGLIISQFAHAHKVLTSTFVDGAAIEGEIGFSNGEMALEGTLVEVFVDSQKIGETYIDHEGFFIWHTTKAKDHHFKSNMGAGHVADFTVSAHELSSLPAVSKASDRPIHTPEKTTNIQPTANQHSITPEAMPLETIRKMINKEMRPLRKEIILLKEKKTLQDIIGGLGYIVGIFGLLAWFKSRKKIR